MFTENDTEDVMFDDIQEESDDEGNDTTDWKAEAIKAQGIVKRLKTKIEKAKETPAPKVEAPKEAEKGLDRLDRAVLRVEKITDAEEIALVETIMKETGKDVEGVLASKYFQNELKEMRDARATKDATPSSSKRSNQSPRDEVDYWIAKGELPPADQVDLRRKVVNAKMKQAKQANQFSDNAVIS